VGGIAIRRVSIASSGTASLDFVKEGSPPMSALARDLDRHIRSLKQLADELSAEIGSLESDSETVIGHGPWSEAQAQAIEEAVANWADNCDRSIRAASYDIDESRRALLDAVRPSGGW